MRKCVLSGCDVVLEVGWKIPWRNRDRLAKFEWICSGRVLPFENFFLGIDDDMAVTGGERGQHRDLFEMGSDCIVKFEESEADLGEFLELVLRSFVIQ